MQNPIERLLPSSFLSKLHLIKGASARWSFNSGPRLSPDAYAVEFERVELNSATYFVPLYARHRRACKAILSGQLYEPRTHDLIGALLNVRPGSMVHAGTFFGDMLPSFSALCPGTIYAFEPVLENYILAKLCIEQNSIMNVVLWNAGLGDELSVAHIDTGGEAAVHRGGTSQISETGQITSLVPLDSFQLADISIIQLDVEGFELKALEGAVETIKASSPNILVEDNSNNCAPFLEQLGYVFVGRIPGQNVWAEGRSATAVKSLLQEL